MSPDPGHYDRIRRACRAHIANGGRIRPNSFGVLWDGKQWWSRSYGCCPIGAVAVIEQPPSRGVHVVDAVAAHFGILPHCLDDLVYGFDAEPCLGEYPVRSKWWNLGQKLRAEMLVLPT